MNKEEIIESLKDMDSKTVEQLNPISRKLFDTIMEILDERDELRIQVSARETICNEYKGKLDQINEICESEFNYARTIMGAIEEWQHYDNVLRNIQKIIKVEQI